MMPLVLLLTAHFTPPQHPLGGDWATRLDVPSSRTGYSAFQPMDDVDGDGAPDFAVSIASGTALGSIQAGVVEVRSGVDGGLVYRVPGWEVGQMFGQRLHLVGDLDRDGLEDLLVVGGAGTSGIGTGAHFSVLSAADGTLLIHRAGFGPRYAHAVVGSIGD